MKSVGIREAKARISELARAAARGEATVLTDYGKPVAMVGPLEQTTVEETGSDAGEFRKALLSLVEIEAAIGRVPASQEARITACRR